MAMNQYEMNPMLEIGQIASKEVEKYLRSLKETVEVINVEDNKHFQKKDIDLLWIYILNNEEYMKRIEVKGDRYAHTGNFFIETMSNRERNNPGCFMYTEADYLYYYFIDSRELNVMPVKESREWFIKNMHRFEEKFLSTKVGDIGYYTSSGRLVPKEIMRREVKGFRHKII